jgi:4-pyridoxate dehydrogenase
LQGYDYVIVGAGAAGCVLANRLTEEPTAQVLLIEAGPPDHSWLIRLPMAVAGVWNNPRFNWSYMTECEPHLDGRRISQPRGKVLGGSTSINMMSYVRGHADDFDRWHRSGMIGWSFHDLLPYFKRSESYDTGEDFYRGRKGPLLISKSEADDDVYEAFLAAAPEVGYGVIDDYNGAQQDGFARMQHMARAGRRSSAAAGYLHPIKSRPNLTVLTSAQVTAIRFDGTRAVGVDYRRNGQTHSCSAREVITCAGAFGSAQLLMLSGVGPAEHLREIGIKPVADVPVGKYLKDHPQIEITLACKVPTRIQKKLRLDRFLASLFQGVLFRRGFGAEAPGGVTAFLKSRPSEKIPDLELFCIPAPLGARPWASPFVSRLPETITIKCALLRPESTGRLWLSSADPNEHPRILTNFLAEPHDRFVMREGLRICRAIAGSTAFAGIVASELRPGPAVQTDAELDFYLRQNVETIFHPCGSCRMGADEEGVVDTNLRVRGVSNLRVVDASVMPDHIGATINAAVVAIAERASDLIRNRAPLACALP